MVTDTGDTLVNRLLLAATFFVAAEVASVADQDKRPPAGGLQNGRLGQLSEEPTMPDKVRGIAPNRLENLSPDEQVAVIIKVSREGYRPSGITPSADISATLFTARLRPAEIRQLASDPLVQTIELGQKLYPLRDK